MAQIPGNGTAAVIPVPSALAVVVHGDRTVLVRRANPPDRGLWGFPGGRIEPGEGVLDTAVRELREETGIRARPLEVLTALDVIGHSANRELLWHHLLVAVLCVWEDGTPAAGDDALEARWWDIDGVAALRGAACAGVAELAGLARERTRERCGPSRSARHRPG